MKLWLRTTCERLEMDYIPFVESVDRVASNGDKKTNEVSECRLPDTELEFMHQIWHE